MNLSHRYICSAALSSMLLYCQAAIGQQGFSSGGEVTIRQGQAAPTAGRPVRPPQATPGGPQAAGRPAAAKATQGAQPGKPPADAKPQRRRKSPATIADPKEIQQPLGKDGRIGINLNGQPWEGVLQWLADLAGRTLVYNDQLPEKATLDFRTRRRYTVEEALDTINGVLIGTEGYTLLDDGDLITVNKVEGLNPGLVPAVEPDELVSRPSNGFVKVIFPLQSLVAEEIKAGIDSIKSKHGKVTALTATNRLEVLDTAASLRRIWKLLQDEQAAQQLVREFQLEHTRADDVAAILRTLLGIKPESTAPMTPQQQQQAAQMAMQRAQQAAQRGNQGAAAKPKDEPKVQLAVNARRNSILITGPPDKIAIAAAAIERLDVEEDQDDYTDRSIFERPMMKTYYLTAVSPDTVTDFLHKTGELSPSTQLQVEPRSRSILAWATPADHAMIDVYVKQIDGNGRRFEVIQLTRLSAEEAAGSIDFLMNGKKEEESNRRRSSYVIFNPFSSRGGQEEEKAAKFRVEADVEHNRILMYATQVELAQVRDLLTKLGEPDATLSAQGGSRLRTIPLGAGDANELLREIERRWRSLNPENPINTIPRREVPQEPADNTKQLEQEEATPRHDTTTSVSPARRAAIVLARVTDLVAPQETTGGTGNAQAASKQEEEQAEQEESTTLQRPEDAPSREQRLEALRQSVRQRAEPAAISVVAGPSGLTVYSPDPAVAERMVQLIESLLPPQPEYTVFYLKKAFAEDVADILEEMFKEDDDDPSKYYDSFYYYYYGPGSQPKDNSRSLSKRKPLKIVADRETNSVFVRGGPAQLAQIRLMIEKLDQAPPQDAEATRAPHLVQLYNTSAKEVHEILTAVYRDFLSPNDPSRGKGGQQQTTQVRYQTTYNLGGNSGSRKLKGLLSIGVDERANTLVISAPQDLFVEIQRVIDDLEQAAHKPRKVMRVVGLGSATPPSAVVGALGTVLGRQQAKPEKPKQQKRPTQETEGQAQKPAGPEFLD